MSIRALAVDLYRAQQKVAELENAMAGAGTVEKNKLGQELATAKKEHAMLRKMLDGEKESGNFRQRFKNFGQS